MERAVFWEGGHEAAEVHTGLYASLVYSYYNSFNVVLSSDAGGSGLAKTTILQ